MHRHRLTDPAPGGGLFKLAFGAVINDRGDVAFIGDLSAPAGPPSLGVFLYSRGVTRSVARPGDAMPGGGRMVTATNADASYDLNDRGDVAFAATLDTDINGDAVADTGLYVSSGGSIHLVTRTGAVIPGLGTVAYLGLAPFSLTPLSAGGLLNNHGSLLLFATLTDGRGVLLTATPTP
jgi:hypothetical protein